MKKEQILAADPGVYKRVTKIFNDLYDCTGITLPEKDFMLALRNAWRQKYCQRDRLTAFHEKYRRKLYRRGLLRRCRIPKDAAL